jgi:cytochrome c peroxidase
MRNTNMGRYFLAGLLAVAIIWSIIAALPHLFSFVTPSLSNSHSFTDSDAPPANDEPIRPIPVRIEVDAEKAALGERLFHDSRLSHDNTVSCASCHDLTKGGADRLPLAVGIDGAHTERNAPTVFNCGLNFKQFWDGRADTLEDQIDFPIRHPKEMASSWEEVVGKLQQDAAFPSNFARLYANGIQAATIKDAIATYERSLSTPNAPFDRFLRGDAQAIGEQEKNGYRLFKSYGCVSCHQGVGIGGNMFGTFGVMTDSPADNPPASHADLGRFNVTGRKMDRFLFKVPSLRNVAVTYPYFHDGSAKTLEAAVDAMAKYQLGRLLSPEETAAIVLFLKTLTGEYRGKQLQ